jgi:3'-5' exoribonuclease
MQVREFTDGCDVAQALLVREIELRQRRDGSGYLRLLLGDRTGSVPAVVWEDIERVRDCCLPGEVVYVTGRF